MGGTQNPDENVVICVDISGSMTKLMGADWGMLSQGGATEPSRLDVVKDVFTNLVTRISAHKLNTHLGLVTFSSQSNVCINQTLTGVLLNFQNKLDGVNACGRTAIWDALHTAKNMLVAAKENNKKTNCRIILLTGMLLFSFL
jgi:Mg-chelatase subunit ChlD